MTSIGERIKRRRTELGMSQEELAKRLGFKSRSSINKIELSERELTQKKIKAIADALETTPSYIMGWDEKEPETISTEAQTILDAYNNFSDEDKKRLLEYAQMLSALERSKK